MFVETRRILIAIFLHISKSLRVEWLSLELYMIGLWKN